MTTEETQARPARERGERNERGGRGNARKAASHPKVCQFCVDKTKSLDYKDSSRLRQMVTEHGKIKSRRITGTCAMHQRMVATAVKRARNMALLPFVSE